MRIVTIAIDGPAGSGKSTLGRELSRRLGYGFLDSGLLYRLVAKSVIDAAVPLDDSVQVVMQAKSALGQVALVPTENGHEVMVGKDRLDELPLHDGKVSTVVPHVARVTEVRDQVKRVQNAVRRAGPAILAGRDIGTVVAPDAELKLYLDVSLQERVARRRWAVRESVDPQQASQIADAIRLRDALDKDRKQSPLRIADDAVVVRTDKWSVDEAVDEIVLMCGLGDVDNFAPPAHVARTAGHFEAS